ncbi:MAG: D-glucuronyl C5-epimerase family protein, partial [Candidatus Lokiarchaeia archaeon]|nr:D-glucuronyl C5-epimerase family protein [Candidatus Lokiarchaeia archaeon]
MKGLIVVILLILLIACDNSYHNDKNNREFEELPSIEISTYSRFQKSFFDIESSIYQPIISGDDVSQYREIGDVISNFEEISPLKIGIASFKLMYLGQLEHDSLKSALGKKLLDEMMYYEFVEESDSCLKYYYPFDHKELKAKEWWSGMANSILSLAYLMGAEVFADSVYYQQSQKIMNGVINHVSEGGSRIYHKSGGYWYCEYVWKGISEKNAYFVLNGFNFQQLCIKIYSLITGNKLLEKYYQK